MKLDPDLDTEITAEAVRLNDRSLILQRVDEAYAEGDRQAFAWLLRVATRWQTLDARPRPVTPDKSNRTAPNNSTRATPDKSHPSGDGSKPPLIPEHFLSPLSNDEIRSEQLVQICEQVRFEDRDRSRATLKIPDTIPEFRAVAAERAKERHHQGRGTDSAFNRARSIMNLIAARVLDLADDIRGKGRDSIDEADLRKGLELWGRLRLTNISDTQTERLTGQAEYLRVDARGLARAAKSAAKIACQQWRPREARLAAKHAGNARGGTKSKRPPQIRTGKFLKRLASQIDAHPEWTNRDRAKALNVSERTIQRARASIQRAPLIGF